MVYYSVTYLLLLFENIFFFNIIVLHAVTKISKLVLDFFWKIYLVMVIFLFLVFQAIFHIFYSNKLSLEEDWLHVLPNLDFFIMILFIGLHLATLRFYSNIFRMSFFLIFLVDIPSSNSLAWFELWKKVTRRVVGLA